MAEQGTAYSQPKAIRIWLAAQAKSFAKESARDITASQVVAPDAKELASDNLTEDS